MGLPLSVVDGDQLGKETHVFIQVQANTRKVKRVAARRVVCSCRGHHPATPKICGESRIDPEISLLPGGLPILNRASSTVTKLSGSRKPTRYPRKHAITH